MIERIQKLEQSNKRLKKYLISLHVILVGMFIVGFQSSGVSDLIETKELVIVDDEGNKKISLWTDDHTDARLSMSSDNSSLEILTGTKTELILRSDKSDVRLTAGQLTNALDIGEYNDPKRIIRLILSCNNGISLNNTEGQVYLSPTSLYLNSHYGDFVMLAKENNLNFSIFDKDGKIRVSIGNQDLIDQNGNKFTSPVSSINLFNQDGNNIFSAPR